MTIRWCDFFMKKIANAKYEIVREFQKKKKDFIMYTN